jgi:hypothetical protein
MGDGGRSSQSVGGSPAQLPAGDSAARRDAYSRPFQPQWGTGRPAATWDSGGE